MTVWISPAHSSPVSTANALPGSEAASLPSNPLGTLNIIPNIIILQFCREERKDQCGGKQDRGRAGTDWQKARCPSGRKGRWNTEKMDEQKDRSKCPEQLLGRCHVQSRCFHAMNKERFFALFYSLLEQLMWQAFLDPAVLPSLHQYLLLIWKMP